MPVAPDDSLSDSSKTKSEHGDESAFFKYESCFKVSSDEFLTNNQAARHQVAEQTPTADEILPYTYDRVSSELSNNTEQTHALELFISYIENYKQMVSHARSTVTFQLNCFMIPSLFLSAALTMLGFLTTQHIVGIVWLNASVNACITLLISVVHFYKFDSTQQRLGQEVDHHTDFIVILQTEFDEFSASPEKLEDAWTDFNKKPKIELPSSFRRKYPILFYLDIFSLMREIELSRQNKIHELVHVKNKIFFMKPYVLMHDTKTRCDVLVKCMERESDLTVELIHHSEIFNVYKKRFAGEIKNAHLWKW
jgi:hypothetical protein